MQNYLVIIGDIVQSRQVADRAKVQTIFANAIQQIKQEFSDQFVSPPTLTIGDEFQAVLHRTTDLFLMIHRFEIALWPVRLRFGLGMGTIETPLNLQAAIGMDGSAFHHARQALEEARRSKQKYRVFTALPPLQQNALHLLLSWIDLNIQGWSKEKLQILLLNRLGKRQKEIAVQLGISQPAVSQHLNKPAFALIIESEVFLETQFNQHLTGTKHD